MIDLSTNNITQYQPRTVPRRDDEYVIVSSVQVAPTIFDLNEFIRNYHRTDNLATYLENPVDSVEVRHLFGSSRVNSIRVTAPIILGGRFEQPSIEEQDFVYFDD
ncbi:MAG: hypothetical protein ACT4O9_06465 [Blastocatellia bacterium]